MSETGGREEEGQPQAPSWGHPPPPPTPPSWGPAPAGPPGGYPPPPPGYSYPGQGGYQPPGAWQNPAAWQPPPGYGAGQRTSGLAIASLVCSLIAVPFGSFILPNVLGLVFGLVARSQIRSAGGRETGGGLATAGIIIAVVTLVGWIAFWIIFAVAVNHNSTTYGYYNT